MRVSSSNSALVLIFSCLLILCFFPFDLIDASSCEYKDSTNVTHDLSSLTRKAADSYVMVAYKTSRYLMNICGTVASCGATSADVASCFSSGPTSGIVLGSSIGYNFSELKNPVQGQPPLAVSIIYYNGALCTNGILYTTRINLFCDKTMPKGNYTISMPGYKDCEYSFNLTSPLACKTGSGSLGGWIFVIILCVGFVLYCAIGAVVNWQVFNITGSFELIPNYAFWKDLPFLVKDGCIFVWVRTLGLFGVSSSLGESKPLIS